MATLSEKFLNGARKIIAKGGFDAQIKRETPGTIDPNDPLGPGTPPVTIIKDCRVFVDQPKTTYIAGSLIRNGDGTLYVDLLSFDDLTFIPQDGDRLVYPSGAEQTLSQTDTPRVNNIAVVTISVVTGNQIGA